MALMRLFYAIPVSGRAALALDRCRLLTSTPRGGYWLEMRDWHVTVSFLGEVAGNLVPALCDLGARVAADGAQCGLRLNDFEWWPSPSRPRLLVAVGEAPRALLDLRNALNDGLRELGVNYDGKPLRPHVTLLRLERMATTADTAPRPCGVDIDVESLALYRSEREAGVTHYRPLWEAELPGLFF
jgi:2'-5' RNA ligase